MQFLGFSCSVGAIGATGAIGVLGLLGIGYWGNGPNPKMGPVWAPGRVDHPTFARSVRSAPRAPGARVLGM